MPNTAESSFSFEFIESKFYILYFFDYFATMLIIFFGT